VSAARYQQGPETNAGPQGHLSIHQAPAATPIKCTALVSLGVQGGEQDRIEETSAPDTPMPSPPPRDTPDGADVRERPAAGSLLACAQFGDERAEYVLISLCSGGSDLVSASSASRSRDGCSGCGS
jgi:hypothetical protein